MLYFHGMAEKLDISENIRLFNSEHVAIAQPIRSSVGRTLRQATERFDTAIPVSAANAQVRQILGRGNEIYLPESGLDRLMLVTF